MRGLAAKVEQAVSELSRDRSGVLSVATAVGGDWNGRFPCLLADWEPVLSFAA